MKLPPERIAELLEKAKIGRELAKERNDALRKNLVFPFGLKEDSQDIEPMECKFYIPNKGVDIYGVNWSIGISSRKLCSYKVLSEVILDTYEITHTGGILNICGENIVYCPGRNFRRAKSMIVNTSSNVSFKFENIKSVKKVSEDVYYEVETDLMSVSLEDSILSINTNSEEYRKKMIEKEVNKVKMAEKLSKKNV